MNHHDAQDWSHTWKKSAGYLETTYGIENHHAEKIQEPISNQVVAAEFTMPLFTQIQYVVRRVFEQYWRTPSYIQGKFTLALATAIFIGFTFYKVGTMRTDLQNALFSIFVLTAIFSPLGQQVCSFI